jgi:hypothetical protein
MRTSLSYIEMGREKTARCVFEQFTEFSYFTARMNAIEIPPQAKSPAARGKKPASAGSVAGTHGKSRLKATSSVRRRKKAG